MTPIKHLAAAAALLAAASTASPSAAAIISIPPGTPALTFGATGTDGASSATRGWSFTLGNEINVTALGFYDSGSNGLAETHQVGIWDTAGTLLVSGTVGNDVLISKFRYTTVLSGITDLQPGDYRLGGLGSANNSNRRGVSLSDTTLASGVTYTGSLSNGDPGTFSDPSTPTTSLGYDVGYFGPDFLFTPVAVPEPAPLAIFAVAGLAMGLMRRKPRMPG